MKKSRFFSFRTRLFTAFLAASLIPLLLCSMLLLQVFRYRLNNDAAAKSSEYMKNITVSADDIYLKLVNAKNVIESKHAVINALALGNSENTRVYSILFDATENIRNYARFDLYDAEGNCHYSTHDTPTTSKLPTDWGILYAAANTNSPITFVSCMDSTNTASPLLQGAAALKNQHDEQIGFLVVSLYQSDFGKLLNGKYGAHNELIVLNRFWHPVYCAQPSLADATAKLLRQKMLNNEAINDSSLEYVYSIEHHPSTGLYFVLMQPQMLGRETMKMLYMVSLTSAFICVVISILTALNFSRQLYRPISQLRKGMKEVVNNNLDVQVPPLQNDELGQLAYRFNSMVTALKQNQIELIQNQKELDQAQIRMLQAQLNPHFLCNTLDTMKWISKINQVPQVALMSTDLADILRFCISPDEFVPLYREAEILERYIEIQKIRLSDSFSFEMTIPEQLKNCLVPKMVLQPIVENAILHGIDGVENGKIIVSVQNEGENLEICVRDDGHGIPENMLGRYRRENIDCSRRHLGLYNVDTILQKHYGTGFGIYLARGSDNTGSVVTAVMPVCKQEETEC